MTCQSQIRSPTFCRWSFTLFDLTRERIHPGHLMENAAFSVKIWVLSPQWFAQTFENRLSSFGPGSVGPVRLGAVLADFA